MSTTQSPQQAGQAGEDESNIESLNETPDMRSPLSNLSLSDNTKGHSMRTPSKPATPAYHPEFLFCGSCTTCNVESPSSGPAAGENASQPNNAMMAMLTKVPVKRKQLKKKGFAMTFVANVNVIDDDSEMDNDMDDDEDDHGVPIAEKETSTLFISNLTKESQVMLINSVFEAASGVTNVKSHLNDEDERTSKTVEITYDPIGVSIESMVKSLQDLGLDAAITSSTSRTLNGDGLPKRRPRRSSLHVEGICCASEVPQVTNILRRLSSAVEKVSINITSRMVYVDHYPEEVGVLDFVSALNKEGFGATIKKDGGQSRRKTKIDGGVSAGEDTAEVSVSQNESSSALSPSYVESTLFSPSLSTIEDMDIIEEILERCDFLYTKIRHFAPNVASRTIKIQHNPKLASAQNVADALMDTGGYANVTVLVDGQEEGLILPDTMEMQRHDLDSRKWRSARRCRQLQISMPKGLRFNVVLSGIFWAISLLGAFVEKWWVHDFCLLAVG